jgi:hypothetical protein
MTTEMNDDELRRLLKLKAEGLLADLVLSDYQDELLAKENGEALANEWCDREAAIWKEVGHETGWIEKDKAWRAKLWG